MDVTPSSPKVGCVAFVLKGYPRLSETFITQEILALEQRGLKILIVSLRHPTDRTTHPVHQLIRSALLYLPEYLYEEPRRVWRAWLRSRRRPGYRAAWGAWFADLRRDPTPNRIRRFGQALVLAAELPENVNHLHAHFLHTPASVARYAALIMGLGWTVSAHAKDIWTVPAWEKRAKLAEAVWVVTCTEAGRGHLAGLAPRQNKVALCYHGLDLERFPAAPPRSSRSDGSDPENPVALLSVGRLVAKKGYEDLLEALALLPYRRRPTQERAATPGRAPRPVPQDRMARRLSPTRRARELSPSGSVRTRFEGNQGRRPRWAAQRPGRGAESAARLCCYRCIGDTRVDRKGSDGVTCAARRPG